MATVEDILMSKGPDVVVTAAATTVREAVRLMVEANVGALIVKDGPDIEGVFTERDLLKRVVCPGRDPETTELRQVMSAPVQAVELQADVRTCQRIFHERHIRHLAVVEAGALLGIISLRDVLSVELAEDEHLLGRGSEPL